MRMKRGMETLRKVDFMARAAAAMNADFWAASEYVSRHLEMVFRGQCFDVAPSTGEYRIRSECGNVYGEIRGGEEVLII